MSAFALLIIFAFARAALASTNAICDSSYGGPSSVACFELLNGLGRVHNRDDSFFSVAGMPDQKPPIVSEGAWNRRLKLPLVHSSGDCNLALLSIQRLDGTFTWTVDNFRRISQTESPPMGGVNPQSIFGKCICLTRATRALGGYRQVPLRPELMIVMYQSGSLYEQFLLSGRGASHYDAAKELPGGVYLPMWLDSRINVPLLNSSSRLSLPTPANRLDAVSDPPSGSLISSRVWRLSKENKK